ncbi:MAG TPA: hypothetical protein VHA54_11370 [Solirubrobacterales bacterium]|nr:hypothetical protein [Solirubrobacterales bacterium]
MRGGSVPLLAWGCLLLVLGGGLAAFSELVPALLFVGGAAPLFALAGWNQVRPASDSARLLPSLSLPVVVLAVGLAAAAVGLTAGLWLSLAGGEFALFGLVWLAREMARERGWGG